MLRRKFLQFFGLAPAIALTPKEWIDREIQTSFKEPSPEAKVEIAKAFIPSSYGFSGTYQAGKFIVTGSGVMPDSTRATGKR